MTLNSMRHWFGRFLFRVPNISFAGGQVSLGKTATDVTAGGLIMGFMFTAMVLTTFVWNWAGHNAGASASTTAQTSDRTIATVGAEAITQSEFEQALDNQEHRWEQYTGGAVQLSLMPMVRTMTFKNLVQSKEQLLKAKQLGIVATDDDVDKWRVEDLDAQKVPQDLGLPASASLSDMESAMAAHNVSIDTVAPLQQARDEVVMRKLIDKETSGVSPATAQDAENQYKQYQTDSIYITNSGRSESQTQLQAQQLLASVKAPGANFDAIAKNHAVSPQEKKCLDENWSGQAPPHCSDFGTAVAALPDGQFAPDLVKAPDGYYIVKLVKSSLKLPNKYDSGQAIKDLNDQRKGATWQAFVTALDKASPAPVILDPGLRADAEFQAAQTENGAKKQADMQAAISDYNKEIAVNDNHKDQAEAYYQMSQAYQSLNDIPNQTANLAKAANIYPGDKTEILMTLGDLYRSQNNTNLAITTYQSASAGNFDDVRSHQELIGDFNLLKRPDLVQQEQAWVDGYLKLHPQAGAPGGPMGMNLGGLHPGGRTITIPGKPAVAVKPAIAPPAAPTVTVQPSPAAPGAATAPPAPPTVTVQSSGTTPAKPAVSVGPPAPPTVTVQSSGAPAKPAPVQ